MSIPKLEIVADSSRHHYPDHSSDGLIIPITGNGPQSAWAQRERIRLIA